MIQRDLGDGTYASYDENVPPPVAPEKPLANELAEVLSEVRATEETE